MDDTPTPLVDVVQDPYVIEPSPSERFNRYRFSLHRNGARVGRGTHFLGGNHIKPWIELQPSDTFSMHTSEHQGLMNTLTSVLEPGSHIMVHYLQDSETAELLTADVPPPVTPLGYLLWNAGVRWFKDWYFTEGWMEGDQKLQGNLPLDAETKQEREDEWYEILQQFLNGPRDYPNCQKRAQEIFETL